MQICLRIRLVFVVHWLDSIIPKLVISLKQQRSEFYQISLYKFVFLTDFSPQFMSYKQYGQTDGRTAWVYTISSRPNGPIYPYGLEQQIYNMYFGHVGYFNPFTYMYNYKRRKIKTLEFYRLTVTLYMYILYHSQTQ